MKKILTFFVASLVLSIGAFAADLSVDAKFDLTGKDPAGSYLTFKGALISVEKDQVDVVTGASKQEGTEKWNAYRPDVKGKNTLPGAFNHLVKYGVSPESQYQSDLPTAWKNADGSITIQFQHRGTAIKLTTDKDGKFTFPVGDYKTRRIGTNPDAKGVMVFHPDFSKDGTVAGIDWTKVWDPSVADGKAINGTTTLTGKIFNDKGVSTLYLWTGAVQVTLNGTVVTVKGDLNAELVK